MKIAFAIFALLGGFATAGELPELLRTVAGDPVTTVQQWEAVRRPELLQTFTTNVFGVRSVERPASLTFEQAGTNRVMVEGRAIRKLIDIRYSGPGGNGCIRVHAFIPIRSTPAPGFLLICNRDPEANIDPERIQKSPFWPVEEVVARGYAALAFYNGDVCPDRSTGFTVGVHAIFEPDPSVRTEESWATISAWAWGASRVMDWIETEPLLDAAHIAVIGHSRGGKTALWTGATDPRFAFVISNDSGCTGAKLNHMDLPSSESIASITRSFPHWFCTRYNSFAGQEFEMPFDQHELLALVAPRLLAVGSASQDNWAGQRGELASAVFASPAWELYGKRGIVGTNFPPAELPMQEGNISYHLRSGGHNLVLYDWNRYMDFVDRHGWCFTPVVDNALSFDTTSGDQHHATNLVSAGGLLKFGSNTLTLGGTNLLGGDTLVCGGTLCADWGAGLDSNHAVRLRGGCLSSPSGEIAGRLGTGAGEVSFVPGMASGFTAKGVPLSVNLGETGRPLVWGSEHFAPSSLVLNSEEADAPLAFCTPLDLYGNAAVISSAANAVALRGEITDSMGTGSLLIGGGKIDLCASSAFPLLRIADEKGVFTVTNGATLAVTRLVASNGTVRVAESATLRTSSGGNSVQVGVGDTATLELNGGTLDASYHFQLGLAKGSGIFRQTAGTTTVHGVTSIGHDEGSYGNASVTGGVWSQPVAKNFRVGEWGEGYLEVSGSGTVRCGTLALRLADYAKSSGRVVLKTGGLIETPKIIGGLGEKREFLFDGGTLCATGSSESYLSGLTQFAMSERGGAVDTAGHDITFTQPLTAARLAPRMEDALVHRWRFNGDLTDCAGGQNATAVGNVSFVDGCARLSGGVFGTSYLNLGANALPKNGKPVTLEIWATQRAIQDWSRIFDFGKGSANANYVTMTWTKGSDIQTDMVRIYNGAPSQSNHMAPYTLGTEYHIAFVLEPLPNEGGWLATAYKQDAVTGATLAKYAFTNDTWSLASQDLDTCYLGHSRQSGNHDASADYNEVRVWNRALSEEELTTSVLAGADCSPPPPGMRVLEKHGEGVLTLTGTNSYAADTRVTGGTLALAADAQMPESGAVVLANGATLALGGNSQTVAALTGAGTVSGGTLVVTGGINPGTNATETAALTFNDASVSGTLTLDATENAIDRIVCTSGVLDLSGLPLQINDLAALTGASYTLATSVHGFTGQFAGANLAGTPWRLAYRPHAVLLIRGASTLLIR